MESNETIIDRIENNLASANLISFVLVKISSEYINDYTMFKIIVDLALNFYKTNKDKYDCFVDEYLRLQSENDKYLYRFSKIAKHANNIKDR